MVDRWSLTGGLDYSDLTGRNLVEMSMPHGCFGHKKQKINVRPRVGLNHQPFGLQTFNNSRTR